MWFSGSCCLNKFWNVTVLQISFQNPLCHLILSPTLSSEFTSRFVLFSVKIWLFFKYLQLRKNTSGSSKYLWLREIPLACLNTSGFENSPNVSSFKQLQLSQISPASNDVSSFFQIPLASKKIPPALDYSESTSFWFESYLKGLVHLGSSCRSWTTLLLPCETCVNRLNMFIILKDDHTDYWQYIANRGDILTIQVTSG